MSDYTNVLLYEYLPHPRPGKEKMAKIKNAPCSEIKLSIEQHIVDANSGNQLS
jgi:hypothetical protein